jgi:hypothetical protein
MPVSPGQTSIPKRGLVLGFGKFEPVAQLQQTLRAASA